MGRFEKRYMILAVVLTSEFLSSEILVSASSPGFLSLPIERRVASHGMNIYKRGLPVFTVNNNALLVQHTANISIGDPPQTVTVMVDSGSSDTWAFGPGSCNRDNSICFGGTVDISKSNSASLTQKDGLNEGYGFTDSSVTGDFFSDTLRVQDVEISQQIVGIATVARNLPIGFLGLGRGELEEIAYTGGQRPYPTFMDNMVSQGIISSKAFSMWLDAQEATTGQVLFGGYDTSKFVDQLIIVNQQVNAQTGRLDKYLVPWTGLSVSQFGDPTSSSSSPSDFNLTQLTTETFAVTAVIDSGTPALIIPGTLYQALMGIFGVAPQPNCDQLPQTPCFNRNAKIVLNFAFGGAQGGMVQVPFQELLNPFLSNSNRPITDSNGNALCLLAVCPSTDGGFILGDAFMRAAYVVYDLDNNLIGLANTNFGADSGSSKPQAIPSNGGIAAIPNAIVATGVTIKPVSRPVVSPIASTGAIPSDLRTNFAGLPPVTDSLLVLPSTTFVARPQPTEAQSNANGGSGNSNSNQSGAGSSGSGTSGAGVSASASASSGAVKGILLPSVSISSRLATMLFATAASLFGAGGMSLLVL